MSNKNPIKNNEGQSFIKLVIAGLIVFLVGGGIVFGVLTMTGALGGDNGENGEEQKEEENNEPVSTMDMGNIIVNLADPGGTHYLKVNLVLEYPEKEELTSELEKKKHVITDAIIKLLREKQVEEIHTPDQVPSLKNEIKNAINSRLTEGEVSQVFFTEFIIQ